MKLAVDLAAFAATLVILATYFGHTRYGMALKEFHKANAFGCFPIMASEIWVEAWPALVLTAAFGAIGWIGLAKMSGRTTRIFGKEYGQPCKGGTGLKII